MVVMVFQDNGKFVDKETLDSFFQPLFGFSQRITSGKWLSLNAVNRIISDTLKGSFNCESAREQGTKFVITLPVE